jgi:hypothetical protein
MAPFATATACQCSIRSGPSGGAGRGAAGAGGQADAAERRLHRRSARRYHQHVKQEMAVDKEGRKGSLLGRESLRRCDEYPGPVGTGQQTYSRQSAQVELTRQIC